VAELAGMTNYCDYEEQVSIQSGDGSTDRPDMVVRMPSNRTIVVDAKTPMDAYLRSIESEDDEERETQLIRHADQVKARATSLSRKAYWDALDRSPEFVVMFLPGEFLLQPALERDPELFDRSMQQRVIIATPNTLMALLKTVEMGWKEAQLAEHAVEVQRIGQELHDRLAVYAGHIAKVGGSLRSAVSSYNSAVGSFDSRVAVSARRFKDLGVPTTDEIPELDQLDIDVREITARHLPDAQLALTDSNSADEC
jgi:DNA recombination protein RmuC